MRIFRKTTKIEPEFPHPPAATTTSLHRLYHRGRHQQSASMQSNSPGGSTSIHRGGSPGSPKGTVGKTFTFEQHGVSGATVAGSTISTTGSSSGGSSGGGRGSGRFYPQKSGGVTTLGGGAGTARDGGSGSGSSPCHCLRAVFFIPIVIFVLVLWNLVQSQISIMSFSSPAAPPVTSVVLPDGGTAGHRASARRKHAPPTYRQCDWVPGGPVFYQLATKLGVNYDGTRVLFRLPFVFRFATVHVTVSCSSCAAVACPPRVRCSRALVPHGRELPHRALGPPPGRRLLTRHCCLRGIRSYL